ncbi:hypothetical protein DSH65_14505 [Enterococcus faecalis]|uniref:Uncharacterized protein n=5 Tax=Enterococcus TaxID=1350 RepID=S1R2Z3_9ENTE|nr:MULTISPECIES: hypothetical protein [Enterococcus]EGO2699236.1 hypothetical protein [Enterococcus faecalis]EGO2741893.1 hypothetical protein [Enterococcus faecalis]EGO2804384.1 hypothetical protein [Enterococcus faecalis]EGO2813082.1 hypothetical protein [Enterococcus faecalis]EGO2830234.1 hypothetical protein [Enterococcus faecalis]
MELLEKEESTFLSLCSPHDRDLLTGRAEMTLQDFERITYLIMTLGFSVYAHNLHKQYMDFTIQLTEQIDREHEILADYPNYYLDEQVFEKCQRWIDDFCNHIPADKQKYYRDKLNAQTDLR